MLGPLTGGSPWGREIGRLRTRGVWEIGGIEGPGPRRSPGLPPRTLFFPQSPKKTGSESAQVLKSYYVPTPFGTLGPKLSGRTPFPAVAKVQRRFPPESSLFRRPPPGTFGVFSDRRTRRVPRPLFPGDEEVGKSGVWARDRVEKGNGRCGKKMTEKRGKKEDDGGREKKIDGEDNHYI